MKKQQKAKTQRCYQLSSPIGCPSISQHISHALFSCKKVSQEVEQKHLLFSMFLHLSQHSYHCLTILSFSNTRPWYSSISSSVFCRFFHFSSDDRHLMGVLQLLFRASSSLTLRASSSSFTHLLQVFLVCLVICKQHLINFLFLISSLRISEPF